jgi:hypothetical protein
MTSTQANESSKWPALLTACERLTDPAVFVLDSKWFPLGRALRADDREQELGADHKFRLLRNYVQHYAARAVGGELADEALKGISLRTDVNLAAQATDAVAEAWKDTGDHIRKAAGRVRYDQEALF